MIFDIGPVDQMTPRETRNYEARLAREHNASIGTDVWGFLRSCVIRIWAPRF
jgi:hypothetical protein